MKDKRDPIQAKSGKRIDARVTGQTAARRPSLSATHSETKLARSRTLVRWQWLIILLLLAAQLVVWAPTWTAKIMARRNEREAQRLLLKLKSEDATVRALAARDLRKFKGAKTTEALIALLNDPAWVVRYEAILSLGFVGGDEQVAAWVAFSLADENVNVQNAAATALGQLMSPVAVDSLVQAFLLNEPIRPTAKASLDALNEPHTYAFFVRALSDSSPDVRALAARELRFWWHESIVESLLESAGDPEASVRTEAIATLGLMCDYYGMSSYCEPVMAAAVQDSDPSVRQSAVGALAKLPATDLAPILAAQYDEQPTVRAAAIQALKALNPSKAKEALPEMLNDWAAEVRAATIAALADLKAVAAVEAIIDKLGDADASVRAQAARALGALRDRRALNPLQNAYRTGSISPEEAITALGELGDPGAIPLLLEQIRSENHSIRLAAALALGNLSSPTLEKELENIYNAEKARPYVQSDLALAARKIRARKKG